MKKTIKYKDVPVTITVYKSTTGRGYGVKTEIPGCLTEDDHFDKFDQKNLAKVTTKAEKLVDERIATNEDYEKTVEFLKEQGFE